MTLEEHHQQLLERREQEERAWRELMDSAQYRAWSGTLRKYSEQEQSKQEQ